MPRQTDHLSRVVLMGADFYEPQGTPGEHIGIGRNCHIRNAIIDKNVRIPENTWIGYDRAEDERRGFKVVPIAGGWDHIVVVPKNFAM